MLCTAMPSILKNYVDHEQATMHLSLSIQNIEMLRSVGQYQPSEFKVIKDMTGYLHAMHVDYDNDGVPTLYDIPSCSIIELRRPLVAICLEIDCLNLLQMYAIKDVDDNCLLKWMHDAFLTDVRDFPRKWTGKFMSHVLHCVLDEVFVEVARDRIASDLDNVEDRAVFTKDLHLLIEYANKANNKDMEHMLE
jgi:hypothetical protein